MAKRQLVSGFTLASARTDLSERAQRVARERKCLARNVEQITMAMEQIKTVARKLSANVDGEYDFHAYGSIEADCYWKESEERVNVRATLTIKALSLKDKAWKRAMYQAQVIGFDFGIDEGKMVETIATEYNAGLIAEGKQVIGNVTARITMRLNLKEASEGATCERVQVGTKVREIVEPVYELVCH